MSLQGTRQNPSLLVASTNTMRNRANKPSVKDLYIHDYNSVDDFNVLLSLQKLKIVDAERNLTILKLCSDIQR